ncbi:subtilisin-like protein [Myriangium duriaei CBS 260.36]|uniref:Subtilisin-like protein n=1 Tax=Myriangium duriaei CBS 260.36 TaxID=1168546 RepID=A0A9P4J598_9PEZI|nr:subtilisin-like protein [Myriangium duriaei CBS 260.36]
MSSFKLVLAFTVALLAITVNAAVRPNSCSPDEHDVTNSYIVTLKPGANLAQHLDYVQAIHTEAFNHSQGTQAFEGVCTKYAFGSFKGYAGHFDPSVIEKLKKSKDVLAVEADKIWKRLFPVHKTNVTHNPFYGPSLISHRGLDSKNEFVSHRSAGKGTWAYVVDSGINITNPEFQGRASFGYNVPRKGKNKDNLGYGTHVAGIIGSKTFGVAKKCNLIAVKVTHDGYHRLSNVLNGYDWAVKNIIAMGRKNKAVVHVSLGGVNSPSLNRAVDAAFKLDISTVAPAGDDAEDASHYAPGGASGAITVASTNWARVRDSRSNYGSSVTLFAPGVFIVSLWIGDNVHNVTLTGTPSAAAYVTGIGVYLQGLFRIRSAKDLKDNITHLATKDVVTNFQGGKLPAGTPNLFAYNGGSRMWPP